MNNHKSYAGSIMAEPNAPIPASLAVPSDSPGKSSQGKIILAVLFARSPDEEPEQPAAEPEAAGVLFLG